VNPQREHIRLAGEAGGGVDSVATILAIYGVQATAYVTCVTVVAISYGGGAAGPVGTRPGKS